MMYAGALAPLSADQAVLLVCLILLMYLPGLAILDWAGHPASGWDRLAMASGLGLSCWPLAFLWTDLVGLKWSPGFVRFALLLCLAGLLLMRRQQVRRALAHPSPLQAWWDRLQGSIPPPADWPAACLLPSLLLIAAFTRWRAVASLAVPPWVDGLHHSLVVQLFLEQAGLPANGLPYLEMPRFYYHFGFHALAAAAAWITGAAGSTVVLVLGQLLSTLILIPLYALALRATGSKLAAGMAAALPASLYFLPAYYLSWSRFTQLAGLLLLPIAWILLDEACLPGRARPKAITLASISAAGLLLLHLRVFGFYLVGAAVLAGFRIVRSRQVLPALVGSTLGGLILAAPWILGRLLPAASELSRSAPNWLQAGEEIAASVAQAPPAWLFTWHQNGFWIRMALIGLVAGMLRGRRPAWALALWLLGCLLSVAPEIVGLGGSWILPPFSLAISIFLPVALGLALGLAALERCLRSGTPRAPLRVLTLLSAAGLAAWQSGAGADPRLDPPLYLMLYLLAALGLAWGDRHASGGGAESWLPAAIRGLPLLPAPVTDATVPPAPSTDDGLPPAPESPATPPPPEPARVGRWRSLLPIPILILALLAAPQIQSVVSDETIIATDADWAAADWIRDNTPADARFLVNAGHWHLGTWRGLDGGYWLPLTAGRATSIPAALYTYGPAESILRITDIAERSSRGDALDDAALDALLDDTQSGWIYIGPASAAHPEAFSAQRLARHPGLAEAYSAGGVHLFERRDRALRER
jgi:hypothetical protein